MSQNLLVSPSCTSLVSSRTRNSSTGKLVSTPGKWLGLPGKIYDVIAKWKKHGATRYPYTDFGVSQGLYYFFTNKNTQKVATILNWQNLFTLDIHSSTLLKLQTSKALLKWPNINTYIKKQNFHSPWFHTLNDSEIIPVLGQLFLDFIEEMSKLHAQYQAGHTQEDIWP